MKAAAIPQEIRDAIAPPEEITVSQWAERYRVLLSQTSSEPGPWRNSRTPYLVGIMDAFSDPYIETIVLCKGSQIGGTEAIYNMLGYAIHQDPGPALVVMPTLELARSVSSTRIQPMIDACPVLKARKPEDHDDFATFEMLMAGMVLTLAGANSPAFLASRPCRYVFLDEVDKFPTWTGREADPISLARERQKTFWNKKTVIVSTPTTEDGQIMREMAMCDAVHDYHVPCPHCGHMQVLRFGGIKWPDSLDRNDPAYPAKVRDAAWYECESCRRQIDNLQRASMLQAGQWRPRRERSTSPCVRAVGFHLPSYYSPWLTWGDIAEAFVRAKDYPEKLMNVVNSWFAEPWVPSVEERREEAVLKLRLDGSEDRPYLPPLTVPAGCVALTAGIDMQKIGFWFTVWAWTRDLDSFLIHYGQLEDWEEVWQLCFETEYPVQDDPDRTMSVWRAALDTGGGEAEEGWSRTEEAYEMLRAHGRGIVWGVRGLSKNSKQGVRVRPTTLDRIGNKPIPGGLTLWLLDTHQLKEAFFWRLDNGRIRLHADVQADLARHWLAEEKRRSRSGRLEWVRVRRGNHLLDASIYAHACADAQWLGGVRLLATRRQKLEEQEPRPRRPRPERRQWW